MFPISLSSLAILLMTVASLSAAPPAPLAWERLPSLPDPEGFASMYAGVSHGALLAAGGANFPGKRPWEGGTKVWYDDVWVLPQPDDVWQKVGTLPKPLGYGVSATWGDEMICAGGSHAAGHVAEAFALRWQDGKLTTRPLPALPKPCANMSWAVVHGTLYVSGGIEKPDATAALNTFWSLDLKQPTATWQELPACPGPARMLAVAGSWDGVYYLFGGAGLQAGPDGKPARLWHKDAWSYKPGQGWTALPDMPRVVVAAPSPAQSTSQGLVIASGDDGSRVGFKPETAHPGFPKESLLFETSSKTWTSAGATPFSLATAPTTTWRGGEVIVSGEARPGYRTPQVWWLKAK
ncbi:MAG TPA: hypothetical protein VK956_14530 [Verrucomicrobium sp.]|nr:hypothetical protein [Verrucomicrobium sp.]